MLHPREQSTNRFPVFKELNPEFNNNTLLDFGGNQGNLLYFSNNEIPEEKYTSLDVSYASIQKGQSEFAKGNFVWWNRYNEMYNHKGKKRAPLPSLNQHDYIWAYSVFSHMTFKDILESLLWMKTIKAKRIITSYLCNDGDDNSQKVMEYFYKKRMNKFGSTADFRNNSDEYFYLTDNYYGVSNGQSFIAVYNTEWLIDKLKTYGIVAKKINSSQTPISFLEITYDN